jgi:hypothetical protein
VRSNYIKMAGRPRIYESAEELEEAIYNYFYPKIEFIQEREKILKPSVTGLALSLGFASKQSLYDYEKDERFSYPIKRALSMIEQYHEERLSENSVTGSIFALKNMGWKDKTETDMKIDGGVQIVFEKAGFETK